VGHPPGDRHDAIIGKTKERAMRPIVPDPMVIHPIPNQPRVVFLKPLVTSPLIEVGEYSYYDDPQHPEAFESRNVLYHYGPDQLVIGKFCAFGTGVRFIMNGANHRMDGVSTFPFPIMGEPWSDHFDLIVGLPVRGDTVIGHDVWLGYQTIVMPGVHIGTGTIVASGSVVVDDLPPYAIAGGNPAKVIRRRFNPAGVERALAIAWWDWPPDLVSENVRAIMAGSLDDLEAVPR
jgi:virginiamycin A acetyltransferase